jgi:hypothetical protein
VEVSMFFYFDFKLFGREVNTLEKHQIKLD